MILKLEILNLPSFLETVATCRAPVLLKSASGCSDIRHDEDMHTLMMKRFDEDGRHIHLELSTSDAHDYMAIISYYAGDC